MSYEHVDLITLVAELHRRREIHSSKRLEYLKAQEIVKKARLEKERAVKAAEAKRAAEARKEAERVAKEAARARKQAERMAAAAKAVERTAALKKEQERKSEELKWSKELNNVLTQHQMETVLQNSACLPEVQAQIRARTIGKLRVVAQGLNKCNFPMTEQQLISLLDSAEKRAMQSIGRRKPNTTAAASGHSFRGGAETQGATQSNIMAQTSMAPNAGAWRTQGYHGDPNGANSNNYGAQPPLNAIQQHYAQSNVNGADRKRGQSPPQQFQQDANSVFSSAPQQQPIATPQTNGQRLWQKQAPQGNSVAQGSNWDQGVYFGDLTSPSPIAEGRRPNSQSPGDLDVNQNFETIFDTPPQGSGGRTPQTAGNVQFQQRGQSQLPAQQHPSRYGHATGQPPYNFPSQPPAYNLNDLQQQQQLDPLLSQFPGSTQQLTPQRQYQQHNPPPPPPAYNQQHNPPPPQPAYNQQHNPPTPQPAYNQQQNPPLPPPAYNQQQNPPQPQPAYTQQQSAAPPQPGYIQQQNQPPPQPGYNHPQNQPPPQPAYTYQYNAPAQTPPQQPPPPEAGQNQPAVQQLQQQLEHLQRLQQQQQYQQQYSQPPHQNFYRGN